MKCTTTLWLRKQLIASNANTSYVGLTSASLFFIGKTLGLTEKRTFNRNMVHQHNAILYLRVIES